MKTQILCITALLLGSVAVCQLEAARTGGLGGPGRIGKIGRGDIGDRLAGMAALGQAIKLIQKEREEYKRQQAVLTGEKIDTEGELPWAFRKLFELCEVSESKIKLAEKRYTTYLKTRDTYRKKRDDMREKLVKLRDEKLKERDGLRCLEACKAIAKLDEDFWKAYNRNYANMLQGVDNYLSSKHRMAWPATSLLAETLSHFTGDEKEVFTDKVFKAKIEAISKEAKTIAKLKTYTERIHKRKKLYDAICKEFKLRKFYSANKTERKEEKREDKAERKEEKREEKQDRKEERKDSKEEPKSKNEDGFGGW